MNNRDMPHNRSAEEALLGSVIIDPSTLRQPEVANVQPDDFYLVKHRDIWSAYQELGDNIDIVSVSAKVDGANLLLADLISRTPSSLHSDEYAAIVRETAGRRKDIYIAQELVREAFKGRVDHARYITALSNNERVVGGAEHVAPTLRKLIDEVEEKAKDPKDIWGIPTGFIDIDNRIGGLQPEQTIMLAAPPGIGKSVLSMQIAKNVAEQGIGVVIYSFEMSAKRVLMRLIAGESGVPTRAMNTGRMDGHWDAFYETVGHFEKLPIRIADIYGMTTSSVRADLSQLTAQSDVQVIVLDYMNKLLDNDGGSDIANTKVKAERMQGICREFQVAGILIESMNKDGMRNTTPSIADMSGPAAVGHEGDNVFLMADDDTDTTCVRLYPAKMRDGDMGKHSIRLRWVPGVPKFANYTPPVEHTPTEWYHE